MARRGNPGHREVVRLIEQARAYGATELNLSARGLTELPVEIGQLSRVQSLNLSGNRLSALPEAIGQLRQLQSLEVRGNR